MEYCLFTEPQQGASYDDQLAFAQTGEQLGFDAYFRSDHFLHMGDGDGLPGPTDAWTTLAGLARETSRIRLGTLVSSVTYRVPGLLAIQVAQVDAMSGGRAELGLGTGWFEQEHQAYGIPFPARRFDLLEEQLEVVTGLWSTPVGETYSFAGGHYELTDAPALPKPVQSRLPVIVGGAGPRRTPELAARFATEFNIGFTTAKVAAEKFAGARAACAEAGRDPDALVYSVALPTCCGRTDAEVRRRAEAFGRDPEIMRARGGVAGTPAQLVEQLAAYQEIGAARAHLQIMDLADPDQLDLIAAEVAPQL